MRDKDPQRLVRLFQNCKGNNFTKYNTLKLV